jgi:hypothetical protein
MRVLSSRALRLLLVAGAILAVTAGVSYATALATRSASSTVIHGCYLNKIGTLRVIDASTQHCLAIETPIQWNQTGPPGPAGEPGAVGSLDALNGIPCTRKGHAGQTAVTDIANPNLFTMNVSCVTADSYEPNDTQATEKPYRAFDASLYPAGDEDWYTVTSMMLFGPYSITVTQTTTDASSVFNTPIHIEIYTSGALVASGDTQVAYTNPSPAPGQTFEVHISGPGPALYTISAS